jgi:NADH-quinone oxidoreductase subunit N
VNDLATIGLELAVVLTGLGVLLADLWLPPARRPQLTLVTAGALGLILLASFWVEADPARAAFGGMYRLDALALFFKRLFLLAALLVTVVAREFAEGGEAGHAEYCALTCFALAGMMLAASAQHFALLFVAIELVTVTFYVLVSFPRRRGTALEAGVKYLILGALASAFLVFGIALVYAATGTLAFEALAGRLETFTGNRLVVTGLLLVGAGLGFKLAAVPFQIWVPDVYQGAPFPTTAFLSVGSKAAGLALLLRVLYEAAPALTARSGLLLPAIAGLTMAYGVLGAIPQRSLRRLMGYSSIANAGFLLVGVATRNAAGAEALLFYLAGYALAVLLVFLVATLVWRGAEADDIVTLAGLGRQAPGLAAALTLGAASLAGIPPLAGFLGKFLLIRAAILGGAEQPALYGLAAVTLVAAVVAIYYYFGLVRAVYWGEEPGVGASVPVSRTARAALGGCAVGLVGLGILPGLILQWVRQAAVCLGL